MPANLAEHSHLLFFFEDVVGATGTAAHEWSYAIYQIYVLTPRDHPFHPLDQNHTPTLPLMAAPKAGTNTSTRHRIQQPEQPKGGTTGKQAAVASSRDRFLREIIHEEQNNI